MKTDPSSRRKFFASAAFGTIAISTKAFPVGNYSASMDHLSKQEVFHRYPSIDDEIVAEVVGASHFNLERVKELVNPRPELARATWDWAFGDWETALGAASHVGRRDIAEFLMSKGARADIFTFAMFGAYKVVRAMIETSPGIQSVAGPHGISLLQHAKNGLRSEGLTQKDKKQANKLIGFLESLGNADVEQKYLEMNEGEKEKYLGDYKYGGGPNDGFSVRLNMQKSLSLGKLGKFGGGLNRKAEHIFHYNGTPSVEISFLVVDGAVLSLTVHEPGFELTANKI